MNCDRNCFDCRYSDCINDDISIEEINDINQRGGLKDQYYCKHKDDIKEKSHTYYQQHKARMDELHKIYESEHLEQCRAYKSEWARRDREKKRALRNDNKRNNI